MNTQANAMPDAFDSRTAAPATLAPTRPLYWSVRREIWENRSIYLAPLAAAGLYFVGSLLELIGLPRSMRQIMVMDPDQLAGAVAEHYAHAAMMLMFVAFVVGVFYCADALYGERRDRSILFWKSLPVSDRITVLAKAAIPLVVLPVIVVALMLPLQWLRLLLSSMVLQASGIGAAVQWDQLPLFQMQIVQVYSVIVMTLWHAPIYAWLLLVSAWAKRAVLLWAVMLPLAIAAFEMLAFHTNYFGLLLKNRLMGFALQAFSFGEPGSAPINPHRIILSQITPGRFLISPGLWLGLIVAAAMLAGAIRLRRNREPV